MLTWHDKRLLLVLWSKRCIIRHRYLSPLISQNEVNDWLLCVYVIAILVWILFIFPIFVFNNFIILSYHAPCVTRCDNDPVPMTKHSIQRQLQIDLVKAVVDASVWLSLYLCANSVLIIFQTETWRKNSEKNNFQMKLTRLLSPCSIFSPFRSFRN